MFLYDLITPHWGLDLGGLFSEKKSVYIQKNIVQIHSFTLINCQVEEHMAHKAFVN